MAINYNAIKKKEQVRKINLSIWFSNIKMLDIKRTVLTVVCFSSAVLKLVAQDHNALEKLVANSENIVGPKISDNGKWVAWYSLKEGIKQSMTYIGSSTNSKKQWLRQSVNSWLFGKNSIALLEGSKLEVFDLIKEHSVYFENVKSTAYIKSDDLLIVHHNSKGNSKFEAYDSDGKLVSQLSEVKFYLQKENEFFVVRKNENGSEVYELKDRKFKKIYSTSVDVLNAWPAKIASKGFIIIERNPDGVAVVYVTQDLNSTALIDTNVSGFEQVIVENSNDTEHIFLTFSKVVYPKKENLQILYATDPELSRYTKGYADKYKVIWNPILNKTNVLTHPDYDLETSIGKEGLFIKLLKDKTLVEKTDITSGRGYDRLVLWDSKKDVYSPLADLSGKMVIHPQGRYIAYSQQEKWLLLDLALRTTRDLQINAKANLYFSGMEEVLWTHEGKVVIQNLLSFDKNIQADFGTESVELINGRKLHTNLGSVRHFSFVDVEQPLLLKVINTKEKTFKYVSLKARKIQYVVAKTTDHVSELQKAKNADSYIWITENYNKTPRIMTKYQSNNQVETYRSNRGNLNAEHLKRVVVQYKGSDGTDLSGTLFLPINSDYSKKFPVVTHIYELQNHLTNRFFRPTFDNDGVGINGAMLLESGIGVFLPDISYSDKGPAISALESVNNAMDELVKIGQVDISRVGLMGHSFGGYQTNFIAAHSSRFASYISGASVSDITHMYYFFNKAFHNPEYWRLEGGQYGFKTTLAKDPNKYFKNNPILYAQNISAPILLWTGTGDPNVNFEDTRSLFLALRKFKKPVIGLFYKDEHHVLLQQSNQRDLTLRMIDWWNYFLKGKKDVAWIDKKMVDVAR